MLGRKLPNPPPLHEHQDANHPAPNWVLEQSKEYVKEYQSVHGKPPIGETKKYTTDEYVYIVEFHHNQKGNVDRTIRRKWRGSVFMVFLKQVYEALRLLYLGVSKVLGWFWSSSSSGSSRPSSLLGNRADCPNCHRNRRRYDNDRFLKCHRCGWVIGYPVLRWLRYPTWIQHAWWWLKNRDGNRYISAVFDIPFYPLRKIDPGWWRILPFKRQHVLLLGLLIGFGIGYLVAVLT